MSETSSDSAHLFWKRKLAAFLHDPPSKCLDIRLHEAHAKTLYRQAGFDQEEELRQPGDIYAKPSDWVASAADRFPFPKSRGNIASAFDGVRAQFHHPLSARQPFKFHDTFASAEMALEVDSTLQPQPQDISSWSSEDQWRARYFCHWRLWEKFCKDKDYRFAFLPADTRIPDHSVWTHMQVVSALDSCSDGAGKTAVLKPAFLKFQLGPVQDFIAEARSIRDLWSGSYLLSWLMAAGLKALAIEIGPDTVIFPNLQGQPLLDLQLRDPLWSQVKVNGKSVWEHLYPKPPEQDKRFDAEEKRRELRNILLTPNLPNVFLAVVPLERAEELGRLVERAIRDEWKAISDHVWHFCEKAGMVPSEESGFTAERRKLRFNHQVERFLSLSWQTTPWPRDLGAAMKLAESFDEEMPIKTAARRVKAVIDYTTRMMPWEHRDGRYYTGGENGPKTELNNIGLGWSIILAFNSWQLDGARQTRAFEAWSGGETRIGTFSAKDSLGGKAEAVAGGHRWREAAEKKGGVWKSLFKHDDWLGATTLIKRLWHLAYLKDKWDLETGSQEFPMPNTHKIAAGRPFESGDDDDENKLSGEKYYAVLALDGDEIGKWVSGEKTPLFRYQFSDYYDGTRIQRQGAKDYFENHQGVSLLETQRVLSPSYHLQFSQALSNFALLCARRVVEACQGRLIYSGGDDVLAMLPADKALKCAAALREAFQGRSIKIAGISAPAPGYLSVDDDQSGNPITFVVPGASAEVSVGIASAHFKTPLQDVVRAAQAAEKRAKNQLGRAAVAISLFKRSGEITEWGAQWQSGGIELYEMIGRLLQEEKLSAKFPYRVCQLLEPYRVIGTLKDASGFNAVETIVREFTFAISRQSAPGMVEVNKVALLDALEGYLEKLGPKPQELVSSLIGLCTAIAFAHRTRAETQSNTPKGN